MANRTNEEVALVELPPLGILRKLMTAISPPRPQSSQNGGKGGEGWLRDKIEKMRTAQCDAEGVGGMNLRRSVMPMCH